MFTTDTKKEKVLLVAVDEGKEADADESLDELEALVETAGGVICGRIVQRLFRINPSTYLGSGKLEELSKMIDEYSVDAIVCDDELSPAQYRNLEDALCIKVMDRTLVILDIFAKRAKTSEGKIQVEMAQLKYRSTRLVGMRNLSRQGGGIGTRGPGERKLESDRRVIRERIAQLKLETEKIEKHRDVMRAKRMEEPIPIVAIAGYTNAGKSTLLNALTGAGVLQEDKLFATLDPTTKVCHLNGGCDVLLTDTVGFIRKLPHHLVEAFKSTLEEAMYADIIIHVIDASNPAMEQNMKAVYDTLKNLGIENKIVISVFNKLDLLDRDIILNDERADYTVRASIGKKQGIEEIENAVSSAVLSLRMLLKETIPYANGRRLDKIRKYGQIISEKYNESGVEIEAYVPKALLKN